MNETNFYQICLFSNLIPVEAATKIQAAFRGHKARAKMKQGDAKDNENGAEREPTKEELEAEFDLNDEGKCDPKTQSHVCGVRVRE